MIGCRPLNAHYLDDGRLSSSQHCSVSGRGVAPALAVCKPARRHRVLSQRCAARLASSSGDQLKDVVPRRVYWGTGARQHVLVSAVPGGFVPGGPGAARPQPWQSVAAVCALAMLLCNFHRSVFTMLVPLMANDCGLGLAQVGVLQSCMLLGYLAGQVPAGVLSDRMGGDKVLLAGLMLWSLATAATASAATAASPMMAAGAARVGMGLASACAMPAVAAMASKWVPAHLKASTIAMVYAFFNIGGVLGLLVTPSLADKYGWAKAFIAAAGGGVLWSIFGGAVLERAETAQAALTGGTSSSNKAQGTATSSQQQQQQQQQQQSSLGIPNFPGRSIQPPTTATKTSAVAGLFQSGQQLPSSPQSSASTSSSSLPPPEPTHTHITDPKEAVMQLAALCWMHAVIGWGFFILQSWIPMYLQSLGVGSLGNAGLLASLPWLAAAGVGAVAGSFADKMIQTGRPRLYVRRLMHGVSSLGCAAALAPLASSAAPSPVVATLCLVGATACYAFSFGGFHAYVQDYVKQGDTGRVTAATNTCSIAAGLVGNLTTGALAQATGNYQAIFVIAIGLYFTSWLVFDGLLRGKQLQLSVLNSMPA